MHQFCRLAGCAKSVSSGVCKRRVVMGEKLAGTKPGRTLEVIVRKETPPLGTHLFLRALSNKKAERTQICNSGGGGEELV